MLLQTFEKRLKLYNMQHVFTIISPDETLTNGNILPETIDLIKKYASSETTIAKLKELVEHYRLWGQSFDLEDLDWTRQLLENSCDDKLKDKINEEMLKIDPIY